MVESIIISKTINDKNEKYNLLIPQLKALVGDEKDGIANTANIVAALKETFDFFWIGFYFVKNKELVLGPFQGPVACTRIAYGKGVCGLAWEKKETILVDDVDKFPGHIACSNLSKSEIVIPLILNNQVVAVLDVDSTVLNAFDEIDSQHLQTICKWAANLL